MPNPSIEEALRRVEASSVELGEKATLLSNKLEEIQNRLRQLPGKAPVEVSDGNIQLSFDRHKTSDWYIFVSDGETKGWDVLTNVSVTRKSRCVPLLPRLFAALEKAQEDQLNELRGALATFSDDNSSRMKEGR